MTRVVIDIPDEVFDDIKDIVKTNRPLPNQNIPTLLRMVADGTVLPKGHGDLIDRSKLDTRERGNNSQRCMWWNIKQIIENAPTVIEADKENGNDIRKSDTNN